MMKQHRERAMREMHRLLMDTRSISTPEYNWLVWEIFGVKDNNTRILELGGKGMHRIINDARTGGLLFETSLAEKTILEDCSTESQAEMWKFLG
jgi:hypothetical protein